MIISIILLIISTVMTVLLILGLVKGKKYTYMVENLDPSKYFLKDLYIVGFYLNETKIFRLRGKMEMSLKTQAKLIWDNIYYEYYAMLAWAQFVSLSVLVLAFLPMIGVLFGSEAALIVLFISVLFIAAIWNICLSKMKEDLEKRSEACDYDFPNMVSKLALLINSGMVLRDAWFLVAEGGEGPLYDLMRKSCDNMRNGDSDSEAIHKFGVLSDSPQIKKFTSAMVQGLEKGNSDLVDFLTDQVAELWEHKRQLNLQKGEVAAGKLIIPLGITFAGIIMIIVSASMQSMSF